MKPSEEDIAYVGAVWDSVTEKAKQFGPPPPVLEGPGFVMIGKPYHPPIKTRRFTWVECAQLALICILTTALGIAAVVYFTSPSIANL